MLSSDLSYALKQFLKVNRILVIVTIFKFHSSLWKITVLSNAPPHRSSSTLKISDKCSVYVLLRLYSYGLWICPWILHLNIDIDCGERTERLKWIVSIAEEISSSTTLPMPLANVQLPFYAGRESALTSTIELHCWGNVIDPEETGSNTVAYHVVIVKNDELILSS